MKKSRSVQLSGAAILAVAALLHPVAAVKAQTCSFTESTAKNPSSGRVELPWRTDFPATAPTGSPPWSGLDFTKDWKGYMYSVLGTIRKAGLTISDWRLAMQPRPNWWIVPWMDYTESGRERFNGLTKERSSLAKDLGPDADRGQLWAIGWYNEYGAYALGKIYSDSCKADPTAGIPFPGGTASIKFLFSDIDPVTVNTGYLQGSPEVVANIDRPGEFGPSDPKKRLNRIVRLLQVDIAVKDSRASDTGWVFGTFVWRGPPKGDGVFDNLEPVGLQWGNDPFVKGALPADHMRASLVQTKIDPNIERLLSGWTERPWLGFQGRVNGPADNKLSSCLSCHGAAQTPRSLALGIVEVGSDLPIQKGDSPATVSRKIARHVFSYFRNIRGGDLFDFTTEGAISLDYSLQLQASFDRMCTACAEGSLKGITPQICSRVRLQLKPGVTLPKPGEACGSPSVMALKAAGQSWREDVTLPRQ